MIRALVALLFAMVALPAFAQTPIAPRIGCGALSGVDLSVDLGVPARVEAAAILAEGRPAPVCHIGGTIRGRIGFEAWLPLERQTQRYLQIGCGGLCGRINDTATRVEGRFPYDRGEFAMAATDMAIVIPPPRPWVAMASGGPTLRIARST